MRVLQATVIAGLIGVGSVMAADRQGVVSQEFIYTDPPTPSCHASTIAETPQGLIAAWFGGTQEKHPDVGIWLAHRGSDGWSKPIEVANGVQYVEPDGKVVRHPCWNPVLHQSEGPLLLFFKCGPSPDTWWGMLTESGDHGKTWSLPRRLPEGIAGPVKNKPVRLEDGALLCPTSSEDNNWRVHFELTIDNGRTWTRVPPIHDGKTIGAIQPSVLFHPDGTLQAVGRSKQGKVFTTTSKDQGRHWSDVTLLDLPNPNSGTDAVTLKDGRHLIVYNHTPKGRSPLNVAVSADGKAWQAATVLESEPGEYSYPAVIQTRDGKVHVTYTWKRKLLRHVVLSPEQFSPQAIVDGKWPDGVR
ncbi:MAG TPA: sialidase family protein [Planctomycetaceae bacterium]|nr:sialidase family protein [Planctomycetaceae bacterium]